MSPEITLIYVVSLFLTTVSTQLERTVFLTIDARITGYPFVRKKRLNSVSLIQKN